MFLAAGCSGPLPNTVPLPPARSSPPVSHHLLHLPEIQSGMENPHPQPIYTSCLTSPSDCSHLTVTAARYYNHCHENPHIVSRYAVSYCLCFITRQRCQSFGRIERRPGQERRFSAYVSGERGHGDPAQPARFATRGACHPHSPEPEVRSAGFQVGRSSFQS